MNLQPEILKGYYVTAEMKRLWAVELQLLQKLLAVCQENHLTVWMSAGTLLGTVREGGFIPWDNDIDVEMPRRDYDKLQAIAKDAFCAPFYFQSGYTDHFPSGIAQLRMDGTTAIEKKTLFRKIHHGIYIDIFPLDILPDDPAEREHFVKMVDTYRDKLFDYCDPQFALSRFLRNSRLVIQNIGIWLNGGYRSLFRTFEDYVKQYQNKDYKDVSFISWNNDERWVFDRSWYEKTEFMLFEDICVPVSSGCHELLKRQYGDDYMIPKQVPSEHGEFLFTSNTLPYQKVVPMYRKKIRREKWQARWNYLLIALGIRN